MSSVPSIKKLDETVVNRIAAGEVIQRPFNALKELIENSLDAKSTKIQIIVRDGGLKLLQITDNGVGIRKEDLEIVCERFTTSKLSKFEDLSKISTYGFRGEALASISHVAHLTITTKVNDSPCGFRASYVDSKLKGPPKPCAAERGTQIIVEELFYNVPTRRNALKSPAEEHNKILEVVRKYAIHNYKIGFSLKKQKEPLSDVNTPQNSTAVDNIGLIYGASIAKELIQIKDSDDAFKVQLYGQITNVNYSNKKFIFLLFINDRLVNSTALKSIIEQTYSLYLPKNSYPFVYLSLNLCPENVDVNVHPTKYEVHFLHEEKIIEKVRSVFESALLGSNTSRVYYTQAKLPITFVDSLPESKTKDSDLKVYAKNTVRIDSSDQKLDKYFGEKVDNETKQSPTEPPKSVKSPTKREIKLRSIWQLKADIENSVHNGLQNFIKNFIVVGFINERQCLLQHETKLYLCSTENLVKELIYQTMLYNFANFDIIRFSTPISIKELIVFYFDINGENKLTEFEGSKEEIADGMTSLLIERSDMLEDYFSIEIDSNGNICTLPLILKKYMPNLTFLPDFLIRICTEVDWEVEKPCLDGICREISNFYSKIATIDNDWKWATEHVLLSSMRNSLLPPSKFMQDGTVLEIANLPDLYKVFERC